MAMCVGELPMVIECCLAMVVWHHFCLSMIQKTIYLFIYFRWRGVFVSWMSLLKKSGRANWNDVYKIIREDGMSLVIKELTHPYKLTSHFFLFSYFCGFLGLFFRISGAIFIFLFFSHEKFQFFLQKIEGVFIGKWGNGRLALGVSV